MLVIKKSGLLKQTNHTTDGEQLIHTKSAVALDKKYKSSVL